MELTPRLPFYATGRAILVVDQESMLPVYRVVYDRSGAYLRTIVGSWALASTKDGVERFPVEAFSFIVEDGAEIVSTLGTRQVTLFRSEAAPRLAERWPLFRIERHLESEGSDDPAAAAPAP